MKHFRFITALSVILTTSLLANAQALRDLRIEEPSSSVGSTEGEVSLVAAATSAVTITLSSTNADIEVPASVTIPAGRDRIAFEVNFAIPLTGVDTDLGCVIASYGTQKKIYDVELPKVGDSLVPSISRNGNNALIVWNEPGQETGLAYDILRANGGVQTLIVGGQIGCSFFDSSVPASGSVTYKVVARSRSGRVAYASSSVTPVTDTTSATVSLNSIPSVLTTRFTLTATLSTGNLRSGKLLLDGTCIAESVPTSSATQLEFHLDPRFMANGSHTAKVLVEDSTGWVASSQQTFTSDSAVHSISAAELYQSGETGPFALSCRFKYFGTWQVQIVDMESSVVKSFNGSGLSADILWEGLDDNDQQVPQGLYTVRITGPAGVRLDLDEPVDIDLSIMWSDPDTVGLVTKYSLNESYDIDVVKHVLAAWNSLGWTNNCILITTDSKQQSNYGRIGARGRKAIRRWLGNTVQRLWVQGHGRQFPAMEPRTFLFGAQRYTTEIIANSVLGESIPRILSNASRDLASNRFTFAWMDTCFSIGGNADGTVSTNVFHLTPPDGSSGWPHAFGMDAINADSENCFIGVNGYTLVNDSSGWRQFRKDFWTKLVTPFEPYRVMTDALHQGDYSFQGTSPWDTNSGFQRLNVFGGYADAHGY